MISPPTKISVLPHCLAESRTLKAFRNLIRALSVASSEALTF